jgi:hypothetical protein
LILVNSLRLGLQPARQEAHNRAMRSIAFLD